jgi:hypothetical protein
MLGAISIALLFVSSATAVPQVNGSIDVEKIDNKVKMERLLGLISEKIQNIFEKSMILDGSDVLFSKIANGRELLQQILSLLISVLQKITQGVSGLLKGFFSLIGSILSIIILSFVKLQTSLTISGIFLVFMGIMSKIGIRILSILSAPLRALFSSKMTLLIGELLGHLTVIFHDALAVAIIFAIPLSIVAAVLFLLGGESLFQDFTDNFIDGLQDFIPTTKSTKVLNDGLLYIMASCIACYINEK